MPRRRLRRGLFFLLTSAVLSGGAEEGAQAADAASDEEGGGRAADNVINYGNPHLEWEEGPSSWEEFGHDNPPDVCGLPVLTVEEWERGRHWEKDRPVLVRNVTEGWAALENWRL